MRKIIITSDFNYINNNYYISFREFFNNYINNHNISLHKISSRKFKKELEEFYIQIYKHDFFKSWSLIFKDSILKSILHIKDMNVLIKYMEYKYTFWKEFFEKLFYSYVIFILTIIISCFLGNHMLIILFLYFVIYIIINLIYYISIVHIVKWNYKSYLNSLNKNNLLENRIYVNEFLENYSYLNNKLFNINNIFIQENNNFIHKFEKIWKITFMLPYVFSFVNLVISISYVLFLIYLMFQNLLAINII
jgi:hypothetical protein